MAEGYVRTDDGSIKISDEVIIRISAIAAREVEGVTGLGSGSSIGDFLNTKIPSKGVKVEMGENITNIDVHITVKFGVKINEIAYKVQEAVKNAVESLAGLDNPTINVFVDGLENDVKKEDEKN